MEEFIAALQKMEFQTGARLTAAAGYAATLHRIFLASVGPEAKPPTRADRLEVFDHMNRLGLSASHVRSHLTIMSGLHDKMPSDLIRNLIRGYAASYH